MMQITHAATAAALGTQIDNIYLAFIGGVVLHFLIDKIPHFWRAEEKKLNTKLLIADYLLTIGFISFLYLGMDITSEAVYWSIAGALVTDIILVGLPFVLKSKVGQWHAKRQPHESTVNGWAFFEAAIVVIIVTVFALEKIG